MDIVKRRSEIVIKIFSAIVRIFVYSVIPVALTLLSVFYIRYVPTVFGNVCGPNGNEFCYQPLPRAGFPFSFWIDKGGVSVMGTLEFTDEISILAFGTDFLFYFLIVFFIDKFIKRWRKRRQAA